MVSGVLGAPGVFLAPADPPRTIAGMRRDVAAFLGVAPRGPSRRPLDPLADDMSLSDWLAGPTARSVAFPVSSWGEYVHVFGGFEGPGRLPYAVSAFFAQGGRQAHIVRIVHDYGDGQTADGRATAALDGIQLFARRDGRWGNALTVELSFESRSLPVVDLAPDLIAADLDQVIPDGSLLRARLPDGTHETRFVDTIQVGPDPSGPGERLEIRPVLEFSGVPVDIGIVVGHLLVTSGEPTGASAEVLARVGLHADHPRWLGRVLTEESQLVRSDPATADVGSIQPAPGLEAMTASPFEGGWGRGRAAAVLDDTGLLASSEGSWGNSLTVELSFEARPLLLLGTAVDTVVTSATEWIPAGSLLRGRLPDGSREMRFVDSSVAVPDPDGPGSRREVTPAPAFTTPPDVVDVVTGRVQIADSDPAVPRSEVVEDVGLRADHPRWLGRALVEESQLVWPDPATADTGSVMPSWTLDSMTTPPFDGGFDWWADVVPDDFVQHGWVVGDPPGGGIHCLEESEDVGLVVAPDLYDPAPLVAVEPVDDPPTLAGPEFAECVRTDGTVALEPAAVGLDGLRLDPRTPAELKRIIDAQQRLVAVAERRRDLTVLLDVPSGLTAREALAWRASFDSQYAAAYHPWVDVSAPEDDRDALVHMTPSAFAAGIIAARELARGLSTGPANQVAEGAVRVATTVTAAQHDELHPAGINVLLQERDGVRLTGARTLSTDRQLRQLTVARLMAVLRLSLLRELQWAVFEPNGQTLWREVRRVVHTFLTSLFDLGAFVGDTTAEAFFVRCDRTTMTQHDLDNGRLVCLIGVAPSEPLEFIELDLALTVASG